MQTTFVTDENELGKEGESHERGPKDRKKMLNLSILYSINEQKMETAVTVLSRAINLDYFEPCCTIKKMTECKPLIMMVVASIPSRTDAERRPDKIDGQGLSSKLDRKSVV